MSKKKQTIYFGNYNPINKDKFIGTYPILIKSDLHYKYLNQMDENNDVAWWSNTKIEIPYYYDHKKNIYNSDFFYITRLKNGYKKTLVEIVNYKDRFLPERKKNQTKSHFEHNLSIYKKNSVKWLEVDKYCTKYNMEFKLLDETDICDNGRKNYLSNKEILPEIKRYIKTGVASELYGWQILEIATRLSNKSNFCNYTWKSDMIGSAVLICLKYSKNFNPNKSLNPFSYLTTICYNAFQAYLNKQKKHSKIKDECYKKSYLVKSNKTIDYEEIKKWIEIDENIS